MHIVKKLTSLFISILLTALCALSIFAGSSCGITPAASPGTLFSFDQKDGTVKRAKQDITGKIEQKSSVERVTYEVYADTDNGELSFKGEASVKGDTFSLDGLKLKPQNNTIVVTAITADGKQNKQTININYDAGTIKDVPLKNVAKVSGGSDIKYVVNNLLVFFDEGTDDTKRQKIIDTVNGKCVGSSNGINMWQVEVKPDTYDGLKKTAEHLADMDGVFYADCNMAQAAASMVDPVTPSDPWNDNKSPPWTELNPNGGNWSVEAVQALSAWGYQSFFSHINVGIVDAGVQDNHEDLLGKIVFPDAASSAENNPSDNHGTHVAGIMGAIPNNNKGITGILWDTSMYCVNWDVLVGTDANLFAGLTETVQAGAKVVNFSLGLGKDISSYGVPSVNPYVISYARQSEAVMTPLLNAGYDFIVVESAGNGHAGYSQDAIYNGYFCSVTYNNLEGTTAMKAKINDRIIIVGSAGRTGTLTYMQATTSNAGSQVDICAPGDSIWSCKSGNTYGYLSGTSMASPMVAAIAALTWSVNPMLTGAQVRSIVLSNTSYTVADNLSAYHPLENTYNMVNAKLAVEAAIATVQSDYSEVHAAVEAANALDSSLYTSESWAILDSVINSVDYSLLSINQPQIDIMAQNINIAINNVILKTTSHSDIESSILSKATTGDTIVFGSYPQSKVTNEYLVSTLNACTPDSNNTVIYGDSKYKRVYFTQYKPYYTTIVSNASNSYQDDNGYYIETIYWFKYEPILWKVLSNANNELFLLSEKILDARAYNQTSSTQTWETCTLRSWLNNDFYNVAFSAIEKTKISSNIVVNDDNLLYGTEGGNNTIDKLFLMSISESTNLAFGFSSSYNAYDISRQAQGTDYSKSNGIYVYSGNSYAGNSYWWLRSPGANLNSPSSFSFTNGSGGGSDDGSVDASIGVRPAIKLNLSTAILTSVVDSGCVVNSENMLIYGLEEGITQTRFESDFIEVHGNSRLEYIPNTDLIGTGTRVNLVDNETQNVIESYFIILFGDINGDGRIDSMDAGMAVDYENYLIQWNVDTQAAFLKAGDVNSDSKIDSMDAGMIVDAENYIALIDQRKGSGSA